MKKIFYIFAIVVLCMALILPVGATESEDGSLSYEETAEETEAAEETVEGTKNEGVTDEILPESDVKDITIDDSASLSEVILEIADKMGISVADAEELVRGIKDVGDKYFGESDLWAIIADDMAKHPARWTLIGVAALLILALIGVLIKRVLSDAVTAQKMKIALENLDRAVNGDEKDESGRTTSIRAMIGEKNGEIESLRAQNSAQKEEISLLQLKTGELSKIISTLTGTIEKMESNSDTSLKITEESALQILQLINIALDRKVPITTTEARKIWYEHSQQRIKAIYEEGQEHGGEAEKTEQGI